MINFTPDLVIEQVREWAGQFRRDEIQARQEAIAHGRRFLAHRKALHAQAGLAAGKAAAFEQFAKHLEEQRQFLLREAS